ncbi:MBL fold metallo-hydrolase [Streptomyces monticola]|uniref:MBL fold metallo-hydrolase n=1 Tax=Streptomyces monticola TaxID=2666263 RepID=A0ABW2JEF8_9ACTN
MTVNSARQQGDAQGQGDEDRLRRPSRQRSLQLGELRLTYIPDGEVGLLARGWLPDSTEQDWGDTFSAYVNEAGYLTAGIGGLLVEHGERALLIDVGYGPKSDPAIPDFPVGPTHGGALLDNLARAGRTPEEIEAVAFTHLHTDHIGWAWHPAPGSDRPAFTRAEYLVAQAEWAGRDQLHGHGTSPEILAVLAPKVRTVADGEEIFPGVRVRPSAGHTPGHVAYEITSGGRRVIVLGDALHTPVQIARPDWPSAPDVDRAQSARARRELVSALLEPGTIGFGVHFADVVFGEVRDHGDGPAWHPIEG